MLDELHTRLTKYVEPEVQFIGINSKRWPSTIMIDEFKSLVNYSIYQDTQKNGYWSKIGGMKDDVFVYDRCGLLAFYIPFPQSHMPHRFVDAGVMVAHLDSPCQCTLRPTASSSSSTGSNCTSDRVVEKATNNSMSPVASVPSERITGQHRVVLAQSVVSTTA